MLMIRSVLKLQKALPKYSKRVSGWTLMKLIMEKLWTAYWASTTSSTGGYEYHKSEINFKFLVALAYPKRLCMLTSCNTTTWHALLHTARCYRT